MVLKAVSQEAVRLLHEGDRVHARIEANGVRVNRPYLYKTIEDVKDKIRELEAEIDKDEIYKVWKQAFGQKTNLGSRQQLARVLFEKMNFKSDSKTKTGRAKTDKGSLDRLDLPFLKTFQRKERLKKVNNYFEAIRREMVQHGKHWYVHPTYNLQTAASYRPSCQAPNFTNVPKRDEEQAKLVRRCYQPHPGHLMVEVDFDMHEVRIGYLVHRDPVMGKYIADKNSDMHRDGAADVFMIPIKVLMEYAKEAKKTVRDAAKSLFVFASFFGSSWITPVRAETEEKKKGTAQNLWDWIVMKDPNVPGSDMKLMEHLRRKGITGPGDFESMNTQPGTWCHHMREVDRKLWERFAGYAKWRRDFFAEYQRRGFFEFPTGFVTHTEHKRNDVTNYVIQGPAFHCLLWCLIELDKWLRKHRMKSMIVGEIYDCMVCSVHPSELQDFLHRCRLIMTRLLPRAWRWIDIPLEIGTDVAEVDEPWSEEREWTLNAEGDYAPKE